VRIGTIPNITTESSFTSVKCN